MDGAEAGQEGIRKTVDGVLFVVVPLSWHWALQEVAVRKVELSHVEGQSDEDFAAVAANMARLRHRNLVTLLGFSSDLGQRLLVFSKHALCPSLYWHLHDPSLRVRLTWDVRVDIAIGIARALE